MGTLAVAGIIEGFYGRPWTWAERHEVATACAGWGMTDYVYAPKSDPKHRDDWRAPYTDAELEGFAAFTAAGHLRLGFGISPGLSIDPASDADRWSLLAKVEQVLDVGARLVLLCLDDIPFGGAEQGEQHGRLTSWLAEHLGDRAPLAVVPTEYVGIHPSPYLDALAAALPPGLPVGWTGDAVVNDAVTAAQAERREEAVGGHPVLLWDNTPVNDGLMADRLHVGPLWGRDPALVRARPESGAAPLVGWLANPMVQPRASLLPLASIAAFLRGEDPLDAWAAEADRRGWRVFAEACDGAVPEALVADARNRFDEGRLSGEDLRDLRAWFDDAGAASAPGLEQECEPWLQATRAESALGTSAIDLIERALAPAGTADGMDLVLDVFSLGYRWQQVLRGATSVMGTRLGFRPAIGQSATGGFTVRRSSLLEGANAVDRLCRLAFDALDWAADRPAVPESP